MKVLIICNDFPPFNSIGGQRPYSWFKYFHAHGIESTVVTKDWDGSITNPEALINSLPFQLRKVEELEEGRIIRTGHKLIYPERLVIKHGFLKKAFIRKFTTFLYNILKFPFQKFDSLSPIYIEAREQLKKESYDFLITTGEPFILFKYGSKLSKEFDIKWIADYRDGWFHNHSNRVVNSAMINLVLRYELYFEKRYVKNASLITSVDPILSKLIGDTHLKDYECIYNGFWEFLENNEKTENEKLTLTHTGTLSPGQRVEYLLQAVSELIREKKLLKEDLIIKFIGLNFYKNQAQRVLTYSEELSDVIITTDRVPKADALLFNKQSDFLLSFTEEKYKAIYTKTYDYIACKRPVLVIPSDNSILKEIIVGNQIGFAFDDLQSIKEFILKEVEQKKVSHTQKKIEMDKGKLSFYLRSNQAKILAEILKSRKAGIL